MARSRSFPVSLLDDPDYFEQSSDTQAILVGLVLVADDEGRGLAHRDWLSRKLNKSEAMIEATLTVLIESGLLQVYHVEKRRYYQLLRWNEWQTLYKPRQSTLPAPPSTEKRANVPEDPAHAQDSEENSFFKRAKFSRKMLENAEKEKKDSPEAEDEKEEEGEDEEDMHEAQANRHPKVLPFPGSPTRSNGDANIKGASPSGTETSALVQHVARLLQLAVTESLTRLVTEYASVPGVSLPGEADAAREWIDDPRRNRQRKRMSLSFFRNWLKREQDAIRHRHIALQQATGTGGPISPPPGTPAPSRRPADLMHLADEDQQAERTKGDAR